MTILTEATKIAHAAWTATEDTAPYRVVECTQCHGLGQLRIYRSGRLSDYVLGTCHDCRGNGEVSVPNESAAIVTSSPKPSTWMERDELVRQRGIPTAAIERLVHLVAPLANLDGITYSIQAEVIDAVWQFRVAQTGTKPKRFRFGWQFTNEGLLARKIRQAIESHKNACDTIDNGV